MTLTFTLIKNETENKMWGSTTNADQVYGNKGILTSCSGELCIATLWLRRSEVFLKISVQV